MNGTVATIFDVSRRAQTSAFQSARLRLAVNVFVALAFAGTASAQGRIEDMPRQTEGVDVDEKLGATLPMDAVFVDSTGAKITLRDCFKNKKTTILTLNYFECPKLCQIQLEGLVQGMRKTPLNLGADFQVVTIDIDPREDWKRAAEAEKKFVGMYERPMDGRKGWHFLTAAPGMEKEIEKVAKAVGFGYKWLPSQKQYSHQPAMMIVSPEGKICRYIYGVEFKPETLKMSLVEASEGRLGSSIERLAVMYCYVYDPNDGSYKFHAVRAMQIASVGVMLALATMLGLYWRNEILGWTVRGRVAPVGR